MKLTTLTKVTIDGVLHGDGHASDEHRRDAAGGISGSSEDSCRSLSDLERGVRRTGERLPGAGRRNKEET